MLLMLLTDILAEAKITTTANVESFIEDLTKKLSTGEEVIVKVKVVKKGILEYSFQDSR